MSGSIATIERIDVEDLDLATAEELAQSAALAMDNAALYRDARAAIQVRDEFVSMASHELKTPLTSVKASAQLLQRRVYREHEPGDRSITLANQLINEIGRLETLVFDLLDLLTSEVVGIEFVLEVLDAHATSELRRQQLDRRLGALLAHPLL